MPPLWQYPCGCAVRPASMGGGRYGCEIVRECPAHVSGARSMTMPGHPRDYGAVRESEDGE